MPDIRIIPSIASADPLCLRDELARLGDWPTLHVDIEDGNFVPSITFGEKTIRRLAAVAGRALDAHILANRPEQYLPLLKACRFARVAAHVEALPYPLAMLNAARDMGMSPGLAMNFATPEAVLAPFGEAMDYLIVMTAEPDGRGCRFHPPIVEKIRRIRALLPPRVALWADGDVNPGNIRDLADAGVTTFIAGRSAFGSDDPAAAMRALRDLANETRTTR